MQYGWLRAFWPKHQEHGFSQTLDLCRNTANNKDFHYRTNSVKIMTNFFFKLNIFFPHFPNFWSKNIFPKNWALMHNFIRVSSTMGKFREISGSNSKKKSWQMPGGKDWQTLFHRVLPATTRELTTTTTIDWHLNVKDKKCDLGLIKNYCITVSMQKNQLNP